MEVIVNEIESNLISASYVCKPQDHRCRYWAKVIRAEANVPMPEHVVGANDVPGNYLRTGDDVELFVGDFLLEGEAVSHKSQRGWTYELRAVARRMSDDKLMVCTLNFGSDTKDKIRAAGDKELLKGSGDVAAMIREICARRLGYVPMPRIHPLPTTSDESIKE
jgi:hypothetical protein